MNHIRVQSILDRYPEAENIFTMYELELDEGVSRMTIEEVSEAYGLDLEDLLMDLEELMQDSKQADWLANGGEEWTDGFTEEQTALRGARSKSVDDDGSKDTEEAYDDTEF